MVYPDNEIQWSHLKFLNFKDISLPGEIPYMGESSIQNYIQGTIPNVFTQGNKSLGTNIPVLVGYRGFVFSLETYFLFVFGLSDFL